MKIPTTLLLVLCVGFSLTRYAPSYAALLLLLVGAYALFDLTRVVHRWRNLARFALVSLIVAMLVIAPALTEIEARLATAPYDHTHDSAIMVEEALKFLLAGKNPYVENYRNTPMAQWVHFSGVPPEENVALLYVPYLPMTFLLPLPLYLLSQYWLGFFDVRIYNVILFVIMYALLFQLTPDWDRKLVLAILVSLHPLFTPYFIEGRNDIFVLFWFIAAFYLLRRQHISGAALALGIGCTTKATAWFVVPFFLLHAWRTGERNPRQFLIRVLLPMVGIGVLGVVPFLAWDARAFIEGVWVFHSSIFHVWGQGVSRLLVAVGIIPDLNAQFPFGILQLVFGVPAMLALARWQSAQPTLRRMIAATTVLGFVVGYLDRAFAENIIGFYVSLMCIAMGVGEEGE